MEFISKGVKNKQLKAIYKGEVKNWKDVGDPDKKVVVISSDTSSGTYEVWHKKVMKKAKVFPGALLQASNGAVAQAVAKNKYAIGYIGLGYLNKDVKALSVNGVVGSEEGTFMQSVHNSKLMSSISCFLHADIIRVTQEFVTPRYLATSAPE